MNHGLGAVLMGDREKSHWRTLLIGVLVVVSLGMAVAACGGDDDDDAGDVTTGLPTVTTSVSESLTPTGGASIPRDLNGELQVFAAASLTDAFEAIANLLEEANPDLSITYNFGGSQQLATQLAEGADADLFASANASQMSAAQDTGVINREPVIFIRNRLAIIVPSDNPADVEELGDLAMDGLKLVVANPDVPVGGYTIDLLDRMSANPAYGSDFRTSVEDNFVSLEDNVKQVVTKVQLGEADAGIVYVSDVTIDVRDNVLFIEIPDEFNIIAEYPVAMVSDGDSELAQTFIDFLLSDTGQAVLTSWGFTQVVE